MLAFPSAAGEELEVVLQHRCCNGQNQVTPYIRKKESELRDVLVKEFGMRAALTRSTRKEGKFALRISKRNFWAWLDNLLTRLYANPAQNIDWAKDCLKMIKPTYQYMGFRMQITLLGFCMQLHLEYPSLPKFDNITELLQPTEKTFALCDSYYDACRTGGTDTWGTTRFQTWRIVCGLIEKICEERPMLINRDLLQLAMTTSVQSPVAEGKAKPLEVIGAKNQKTGPFKEFAKEWGVVVNDTPSKTSEKVYKWVNPIQVDDTAQLDSLVPDWQCDDDEPVVDDDDYMMTEQDEMYSSAVVDIPPAVVQPQLFVRQTIVENYLDHLPVILQLLFDHFRIADGPGEPVYSNAVIEKLAEEYLIRKNGTEEYDNEGSNDPSLFMEVNGFDEETVAQNFGVTTYIELEFLINGGSPQILDEFEKVIAAWKQVMTEWGRYSILTLKRALGYINMMYCSMETDSAMADPMMSYPQQYPPEPPTPDQQVYMQNMQVEPHLPPAVEEYREEYREEDDLTMAYYGTQSYPTQSHHSSEYTTYDDVDVTDATSMQSTDLRQRPTTSNDYTTAYLAAAPPLDPFNLSPTPIMQNLATGPPSVTSSHPSEDRKSTTSSQSWKQWSDLPPIESLGPIPTDIFSPIPQQPVMARPAEPPSPPPAIPPPFAVSNPPLRSMDSLGLAHGRNMMEIWYRPQFS